MNKILNYILILFCFTTLGCNEQANNTKLESEPESLKGIEGLTELSEEWVPDSSIYWTRDKDSIWQEIIPRDTLLNPEYIIRKMYYVRLKNDLTVKKLIDIDPKTKNKISETDIYAKRLNLNIESRLVLTYNFKTENYYSNILDSTATSEKMKANRMKADSMMNYAGKNDLYLCGTAYIEILWEGVPFLPIPREIEKDSALLVIDEWTKN